jgi:hypothetical protein
LSGLAEKILAVSAASAAAMAVAAFLPRLPSTCLAEASSTLPSGVASLIAASGSAALPFKQVSRLLEAGGRPLDGGEQLGHADAAVAVGVDHRESPLVELKALDGAAQGHPQLLVELFEIEQVGAGFEGDLVEFAGPEKFPNMHGNGCDVGILSKESLPALKHAGFWQTRSGPPATKQG